MKRLLKNQQKNPAIYGQQVKEKTMTYQIKQAVPEGGRIMMAIAGPSASGKTTSALRLAEGIVKVTGGKIVLADTENKRALQYAKAFKFNHLEIDPPFSPENYDKAFQFIEKSGYGQGDVIIIDSMTHEHEGPGGVLELHSEFITKRLIARKKDPENLSERDKYNMLAWNFAKAGRKRFLYFTLQRTKCHVILCFRAKEKTVTVFNNGKMEYVKEGFQPIGADEYFFEMDITMILPLGAQGKPDWNEKSARINEYGEDGPLKKLLKNIEQVSQSTGEQLARIITIPQGSAQQPKQAETVATTTATPPAAEETPEQKIKRLAGTVIRAIHAAKDLGDIDGLMHEYKEELDTVKAASQAAYDHVMKEKSAKMAALEGK